MQDKYGQGSRGELVYKPKEGTQEVTKPTVPNDNEHQDEWNAYNEYIANRTLSGELAYGPELDGRMERTWNGELIPYSYYGNKLKDYFDTGFSQFHSVSVGSSTENPILGHHSDLMAMMVYSKTRLWKNHSGYQRGSRS